MKKVAACLAILLCCLKTGAHGAFELMEGSGDFFSANPASLRMARDIQLTSFYERVFSLNELAYAGSSLSMPLPWGGAGLGYDGFGNSSYRESRVYASHGFKLAERVCAGVSLKGFFLSVDEFGSSQAFGADVGMLMLLTGRLNAGMVARNVNRPAIGSSREALPGGFSAGLSFSPMDGLWWSADFEQMSGNPAAFKSSVSLAAAKFVLLRGGIRNHPAEFLGGFGVGTEKVRVDYDYTQSGSLPPSHRLVLSLKFSKRNEKAPPVPH